MKFYFQVRESQAVVGMFSPIYSIPQKLLDHAIPCEIEIKSNKTFYDKLHYVEPYSNQFEPILHLEAMIFAIRNRLPMEFHLRYTPIFGVKFEEDNIILTRGKGDRVFEVSYILAELQKCLDAAICFAESTVNDFSNLYLRKLYESIPQAIDSRYV